MDTIFMNSKNSTASEYRVLVLKLTDKLDLRSGKTSVALSNLSIYYTWKNIKSSSITISLIYLLQHGVMNFNYQTDHIQYQIFKIILSIFLRNSENVDNPSIRIYVKKLKIELHLKLKMDIILNF